MMTLAFRSPLLALIALVPNVLPILCVLGAMGWLGVPLDVASVMTGSIAFGVAVDDTYHYLWHCRSGQGVVHAAAVAGQGIVATSLILAGGFATLMFSGFNPVVRLGALLCTAVLCALATDALVLPALVGKGSCARGDS